MPVHENQNLQNSASHLPHEDTALLAIVPAKTYRPEIQGILVQNGYMTASNTELTVHEDTALLAQELPRLLQPHMTHAS